MVALNGINARKNVPQQLEQGASMTDREAMKMALAKLEHLWEIGIDAEYKVELLPEIEVLRQALAQPEQEPVAWIGNADFVKGQFVEGRVRRIWWECNTGVGQPLYTAPPKREWVGLTDEECRHFNNRLSGSGVAEEIDALLKEKNGGAI
jgi:hypothetical protein